MLVFPLRDLNTVIGDATRRQASKVPEERHEFQLVIANCAGYSDPVVLHARVR